MKIDFHVHTIYSYDACDTPEKIIDQAIANGLDGVCITDHNNVKGLKKATAYGQEKGLLVIPGIEVHTQDGHMLGINIGQAVESGMTFEKTVEAIRRLGGMSMIAHPFLWRSGFTAWDRIDLGRFRDFVDGVEISNASGTQKANQTAQILVKKYNMPFIAGSDAHIAEFVGKRYLEIPVENLNPNEVIKFLMSGAKSNVQGSEMTFIEKINTSSIILREGAKTIRIEKTQLNELGLLSARKPNRKITVGGNDINLQAILKNRLKRIKPKLKHYLGLK